MAPASNWCRPRCALFAVGLLPFAAFLLFARAFYARQDSRTPALVNLVENAVTVALDFALFPGLEVPGLALAHSLGYVAGARGCWAGCWRGGSGGWSWRARCAKLSQGAGGRGRRRARHGRRRRCGRRAGRHRATCARWLQLGAGALAGAGAFLVAGRVLAIEDLALLRRVLPGAR